MTTTPTDRARALSREGHEQAIKNLGVPPTLELVMSTVLLNDMSKALEAVTQERDEARDIVRMTRETHELASTVSSAGRDALALLLRMAEKERDEARAALRFYGDAANYTRGFRNSDSYAEEDSGTMARVALGDEAKPTIANEGEQCRHCGRWWHGAALGENGGGDGDR